MKTDQDIVDTPVSAIWGVKFHQRLVEGVHSGGGGINPREG